MPLRAVDTGQAATASPALEQGGDLALGVDHQQTLGQGGRRAGAHQALARESERAGGILVGGGGHARTLPYRGARAVTP